MLADLASQGVQRGARWSVPAMQLKRALIGSGEFGGDARVSASAQ